LPKELFEEWVRIAKEVKNTIGGEKQGAQLMNGIPFQVWTQTELLEFFLTIKRTLKFPFAIELACKNGWEMIFILRKTAPEELGAVQPSHP
jgi:hypothetical protein